MINWRICSYSIALGVIITAVSFHFFSSFGEFVLWPGTFLGLLLDGLLLLIPSGDYFISISDYTVPVFNIIIFAVVFYGVAILLPLVRENLSHTAAVRHDTSDHTLGARQPDDQD